MIEDIPTFGAQRRNLLITSSVLLVVHFTGVSLRDLEFLGLKPSSGTAGEIILLIVCLYSFVRFIQVTDEEVVEYFEAFFDKARMTVIVFLGGQHVRSVVRHNLLAKAGKQNAWIVYVAVRAKFKSRTIGNTNSQTGASLPDGYMYLTQTECMYTGPATWKRSKVYEVTYESGNSGYNVSANDLAQQSRIRQLTLLYTNLRYPPATEIALPIMLGLIALAIYTGRLAAMAVVNFAQ